MEIGKICAARLFVEFFFCGSAKNTRERGKKYTKKAERIINKKKKKKKKKKKNA